MTIVTDAPPVAIDSYRFLTGKKHTQTSGFKHITRSMILEIIKNPPECDPELSVKAQKERCHWLHPSNASGKLKSDVEAANSCCALWCDIDQGDLPLAEVRARLERLGIQSYAIYSTLSHKADSPKTGDYLGNRWRVLVWLSHEIDLDAWSALSDFLAHELGGDLCSTRLQQIIYLPLASPSYENFTAEGVDLNPDDDTHPFIAAALAFSVCVGDDIADAHPPKPKQEYLPAQQITRRGNDAITFLVNHESIHVGLSMAGFDYDQRSGKYRPPGSDSPHGVAVKDERAYFHHTSSPLADGHAHDVFDVVHYYLCGGDFERASAFAKGWQQQFGVSRLEISPELVPYPVIGGLALLDLAKSPQWLIKHLIPAGEMGMLVAASQSFKSFVALEVAHCVATGRPFGPYAVKTQGPVVFVIGEGGRGFGRRVEALYARHGYTDNLHLIQGRPSLSDASHMARLQLTLVELQPVLVVVDTFSALSGINDENANAQVSKVLAAVRDACGDAAVLVVHHLGKDSVRGMRGASAFLANSDFVLKLCRSGVSMLCELEGDKLKDGALPPRLQIKMAEEELRRDEDGEPVTSLVVESINAPKCAHMDFSVNAGSVLRAIRECHNNLKDQGAPYTNHEGYKVLYVPRAEVREWLEKWGYAKPREETGNWDGATTTAFKRAIDHLQSKGKIGVTAKGKNGNLYLYPKADDTTIWRSNDISPPNRGGDVCHLQMTGELQV